MVRAVSMLTSFLLCTSVASDSVSLIQSAIDVQKHVQIESAVASAGDPGILVASAEPMVLALKEFDDSLVDFDGRVKEMGDRATTNTSNSTELLAALKDVAYMFHEITRDFNSTGPKLVDALKSSPVREDIDESFYTRWYAGMKPYVQVDTKLSAFIDAIGAAKPDMNITAALDDFEQTVKTLPGADNATMLKEWMDATTGVVKGYVDLLTAVAQGDSDVSRMDQERGDLAATIVTSMTDALNHATTFAMDTWEVMDRLQVTLRKSQAMLVPAAQSSAKWPCSFSVAVGALVLMAVAPTIA